MTIHHQIRAAVAAALLGALTVPAFAHAALVSEVPAADATVAAPLPTELTLGFSEGLELAFTRVVVKAPDGADLPVGPLALGTDGKTLTVPLSDPLPAGAITIEWTAVAKDGHKSKGSYTFTVGR